MICMMTSADGERSPPSKRGLTPGVLGLHDGIVHGRCTLYHHVHIGDYTFTSVNNSSNHPSVKSALRVCRLLAMLADRPGLTHADMAHRLAMPKSSVTALLTTLEAQHFVQKDAARRFFLGPEVLGLAHRYIANLDLGKLGQPVVDDLMLRTHESVALSVASGSDILIIAKANCQQPLQRTMQLGERAPMCATAGGKAILAFLPANELDLCTLSRTPSTSTSINRRKLMQELKTIRAGRLAYSREELIAGIVAVGAPVFDSSGLPTAALSVAVPSVRFSPKREALIANAVRRAAETLSRQLGYSSSHSAKRQLSKPLRGHS